VIRERVIRLDGLSDSGSGVGSAVWLLPLGLGIMGWVYGCVGGRGLSLTSVLFIMGLR
jgi:hypothetical protein